MLHREIKAGSEQVIIPFYVADSSSYPAALTGLAYNTASLVCYYKRSNEASETAITLVAGTVGSWVSSGFAQIDAANMPGLYELSVPNTVLRDGVDWVLIELKGAANMSPVVIFVDLVPQRAADAYDAAIDYSTLKTRLGLSDIQRRLPMIEQDIANIRNHLSRKS